MPQAPLPAPANRITVPELIHPIVQQIGQPFNVMPYMQYPDMVSAATRGLELGAMIGKLPRSAHENAAASASAAIANEQLKSVQDDIKFIQNNKNLDPSAKAEAIRQLTAEAGMTWSSSQGGTIDSLGAAIKQLGLARGVQEYQQSGQLFPSQLQSSQQAVVGGPAAAAAGSTNVAPQQGQPQQQGQQQTGQPQQQPKEHLLNNSSTMVDPTSAANLASYYPVAPPIASPSPNFNQNSYYPQPATFLS